MSEQDGENIKLIKNLKKNYEQIEQSLVEQLYLRHEFHGTTIGSQREDIWKQLFEMILPKKFVMEQSVFIIDSSGRRSNEVDLAIVDEMYTPYIFRYGRLKFIPIEAVAAVVECKSKTICNKIEEWCQKIKELKTAEGAIVRLAREISSESTPTQRSTRPIRILCTLAECNFDKYCDMFDFVLRAVEENHCIKIMKAKSDSLYEWYENLNFNGYEGGDVMDSLGEKAHEKAIKLLGEAKLSDYQVRDESQNEISLLTFNFQLNQLLMLINNPMLFPHLSYVKMFNP